eukprot:m.104835 g.104835  ORF g.104835 m.104835 type:complete len:59 (-) comp15263_c0_seq3:152-328(-)
MGIAFYSSVCKSTQAAAFDEAACALMAIWDAYNYQAVFPTQHHEQEEAMLSPCGLEQE